MALAQHLTPDQLTALYLRLSDDDEMDALAVARQRKDMTGHAQRLGLPVVEFCDNSYSASRYARRARPAYDEMLRGIEAGQVRHVVIWDLSRLTRQPKELERLIDLADAGTVEVHTMTGKLDIRDGDGRAMARVVCAMNAKTSDDASKRIKRKQAELREAGRYHGGGRPFGFEPDGTTVRPAEAILIVEAAVRTLKGDGLLTIARSWQERGITAPLGGTVIRRKMIKDALLRPLTVSAGILTADVQEELRAVLMDPSRRLTTTTARTHLLSGLLTCEFCRSPMRSKPRNRRPSYACDTDGCRKVAILADPLDGFIRDAICHRLSGPGLTQARQERRSDDPATGELVEALQGFEGRLSALEADYMDGGTDLPTFKRMKSGFEARITETRKALARVSKNRTLTELPDDVPAWWPTATLDQRRAVILAVVEKMTVGPAHRGVRTFDASRVTIIWRDGTAC